MRTKSILQAVMLILLLTMLVLSPVAYGQDSSAATASGGGGGGGTSVMCPTLLEPVCGVDGKTYSNSCTAGVAGIEIGYAGECKNENLCAQEGEMCAGIAGISCCDGLACEMEGTYPDAAGKCVSSCGVCPQFSPPHPDWCNNGTIIAGSVDKCGCRGPPKCEKETPKENRFRNAYWQCYDGTESYEGGPTSCKSSETWQEYAEEFCKGHCSSNADATATTDNVEGTSPKCGVNTFKVWNPCYELKECSRDLEQEECEAAGGRYVAVECPACPADAVCKPCMLPYCECKNVVYCEDSPYNPDCVCRNGERVPEYEEPACEEEKPCPTIAVQVKYKCVTKEKVIKTRLGEPFELETPQTAVIVDYNEMQVKLTAIDRGVRTAISSETMPPVPDRELVAHLVITLPGSKKLVQVREETRATIASITGRSVASSAGGGGGATATTTGGSGGGGAMATTPGIGNSGGGATSTEASVMPRSGAKVIRLRQGESADVFGATISVEKLDKEHGVFVVSKKDIVPCAEYTKCDDGTIKPCYQEGNVCVCEACEVIDFPLCKPTVCPNGEKVECEWDGESCVCESCNIDYTPLCGNGICEDGEGMVCQGAGSDLGTAEEVCYISCPEDCGTIEEPSDCDGCVTGMRCLPYGSRRLIEDAAVYCDFEGTWQGQLAEGEACQNDYECETNACSSGKCLDLEKEISGLREMFRKILDLLSKLFG